jgi:alkylation response protein AidB-like acyl-CoA dehydrogenase
MPRYVQAAPELTDPYASDTVAQSYVDRYVPADATGAAHARLAGLGADIQTSLRAAHTDAETHPPLLRQYDAYGRRVDRIETAPGWEAQRVAAARHAVVALPYLPEERARYGAAARVVQHAVLHLYGAESATFSCPVAMSDGAAALLSRPDVDASVRAAWLPRLLSTDPDTAICSGQWMTESQGGSDISRSTTTARPADDTAHEAAAAGDWRLTGEKWFCSAADSAMAVALARPEGAAGGSRTLAPFVVPRYDTDGWSPAPGVRLHRLKDKLGTRAVPTAEIGLDGATAYPVGDPHSGGLRRMMTLVVVTRLHNAAAAAGGMRRGLDYALAYARARQVAGGQLIDNPLHRATLAQLAVEAEAAYCLTTHAFALLGRVEAAGETGGEAGGAETAAAELRLVAPLAKIATGKAAVASASEYLECFGGAGFVEDTGIPRLLRDAQVLPIWEGTTNVLSVDVARALGEHDTVKAYVERIDAGIDVAAHLPGGDVAAALLNARRALGAVLREPPAPAAARDTALLLARTLTGVLLAEHAGYEWARGDEHGAAVASLWAARHLDREDTGASAAAQFELVLRS